MTGMETRSLARDSLFLLATLQIEQQTEQHRVRVRNLSDGGMMAEAPKMRVQRGDRVLIGLRNIGDVMGSVAWVQDDRFGIAFDEEIDSQMARRPLGAGDDGEAGTATPSWAHRAPPTPKAEALRKI